MRLGRLRRLYRRVFGVNCSRCGGTGTYFGYSPFDSLATFRHAGTLTCYWCGGRGRWSEDDEAQRQEAELRNWRDLCDWLDREPREPTRPAAPSDR